MLSKAMLYASTRINLCAVLKHNFNNILMLTYIIAVI